MITFDHVTKKYRTNIGLDDVSVHINKGDFVFLVGPSGAGKSTFIKLILKEINADDVVEAGTPLVVLMASGDDAPGSYNITVDWQNDVITYEDFVYAAEGKNVNGLVGVIAPVTTSRGSYLANGNLAAVSENQVINTYSGYFLEIPETTENGDAVIAIPTGIENAVVIPANQMLNVYTISGIRVRTNVEGANALKNLPSGLYIVGGKKVFVK